MSTSQTSHHQHHQHHRHKASPSDVKLFKCIPVPKGSFEDVHVLQSLRMATIHNVFIRAYNSILYYSAEVEPDDAKRVNSFMRYCDLVNEAIHLHHEIKEEHYYPWLDDRLGVGAMAENVKRHREIQKPFVAFEELVTSIRETQATFDPDDFRAAIYNFMTPFVEHLKDEIDTLRPHRMKQIPEDELWRMELDTEVIIKKKSHPTTSVQLMMINSDGKYGVWLPVSPPTIWVCMNTTYYLNTDLWAFGACDRHRVVKPQFIAYEPELEHESHSKHSTHHEHDAKTAEKSHRHHQKEDA
ncbi:hypothetical protein FRB94_001281 [Tulasnella sp. JGI-2019a]|nr:hypothetical protein FRB93_007830 [Tulasnella sp. JGI-2019a]KAG9013719.1 hypothetical protein FRB94_001281 [Tulasnella sp. JGI-2019a]KAG9037128.1 hypothetical protein FRB95_006682 [Tulasnella sp. JGI-2019a]